MTSSKIKSSSDITKNEMLVRTLTNQNVQHTLVGHIQTCPPPDKNNIHVFTLNYDSDVPSASRRWFLKYSTRVCWVFSTSLNLFQTRNSQRASERTRERRRATLVLTSPFSCSLWQGCPFSLAPMVIWGSLYSFIFLLIHFVNQYSILLGTNKTVVVVVSRAALA